MRGNEIYIGYQKRDINNLFYALNLFQMSFYYVWETGVYLNKGNAHHFLHNLTTNNRTVIAHKKNLYHM